MTSIKYAHLHVMGTITRKFHQNPLNTVRGVAETRLYLRMDEPITIVPFDLRRGTKKAPMQKKRKNAKNIKH